MNNNQAQSTAEDKEPAFRTIGDVAEELGIAPHVIRFWETKFPELKPHKGRGGHRYYRTADMELIRTIKSLLHEQGYTIKGARTYIKNHKDSAQEQQASLDLEYSDNTKTEDKKAQQNISVALSHLQKAEEILAG